MLRRYIYEFYANLSVLRLKRNNHFLADDGEPNFDPIVCMTLTSQAVQAMGISAEQANRKLLIGVELGAQFGACNGVSAGWCDMDLTEVTRMAADVLQKGYGGIFYWPNVVTSVANPYYSKTYPMMRSAQSTSTTTSASATTTAATSSSTPATTTTSAAATTSTSQASTSTTPAATPTSTSSSTPTQTGGCANPAKAVTASTVMIGYWHVCHHRLLSVHDFPRIASFSAHDGFGRHPSA